MTDFAQEWTFESAITMPGGIKARVVITVPVGQWREAQAEGQDVAGMAASRAVELISKAVNEPPF